jgi:hypothetical protein
LSLDEVNVLLVAGFEGLSELEQRDRLTASGARSAEPTIALRILLRVIADSPFRP